MRVSAKAVSLACAACVAVSGYVFSARSLKNVSEVRPELQTLATCALQHTPVDFVVIDGGRTEAEHQVNLTKGVSWIRRSKHQDGLAIDIAAWVNGEITYEPTYYYSIAGAFYLCSDQLNIPITWGGEWKAQDLMHFELQTGGY